MILGTVSIAAAWRRAVVQATEDYYDGLNRRCIYLGARKIRIVTLDVTFFSDVRPCSLLNGTNIEELSASSVFGLEGCHLLHVYQRFGDTCASHCRRF